MVNKNLHLITVRKMIELSMYRNIISFRKIFLVQEYHFRQSFIYLRIVLIVLVQRLNALNKALPRNEIKRQEAIGA